MQPTRSFTEATTALQIEPCIQSVGQVVSGIKGSKIVIGDCCDIEKKVSIRNSHISSRGGETARAMHRRTDDDDSSPPVKPVRRNRSIQEDIADEDDASKASTIVSQPSVSLQSKSTSSSDYKSAVNSRTTRADETTNASATTSKGANSSINDASQGGNKASASSVSDEKSLSIAAHAPIVARSRGNGRSSGGHIDSDAANGKSHLLPAMSELAGMSASQRRFHPGAHQVGGQTNADMAGNMTEDQSTRMSPIVASVVEPEADFESQTQDIEKRVREEMMKSTVTAELVEITEEEAEIEPPTRKKHRLWIILGLIALLVIGVIIGLTVALMSGTNDNSNEQSSQVNNLTGPPSPAAAAPSTANPTSKPTVVIPPCTLCFDGTEPIDLTPEVRRGVTCADLQINLGELDKSSAQICKSGQATAWFFCSCPTLPPRPLSSVCSSACPVDSRPPAFDSEVCRNFETFVEIVGQQENECAGLIELTPSACVCSPRIADMRDILKSVSDEQDLLDISTPQYMALEWLANKDPANLTISETSGTALQNRYFGALLWFGFGGENWDEQYSFKSESDVCDWNDGDFGIFCDDPAGTSLITKVKMNNNTLVGRFPDEFTKFTNLVSIMLFGNFISGTFPAGIGDLTELQYFDLDGNEDFGGRLPSSLFELRKLLEIWLNHCNLVGSLPENIGNAVSLTSLIIPNAGLTGTIPASLSELSGLQYLQLNQNELSGNLPNLEEIPDLFQLDLSENSFGGTIPAHYGQFQWLERLVLDQNFLTGSIPDLSGNIRMWYLYLHDNILTGNLERVLTMTPATFILRIGLDNNELTGSIPAIVANFQKLDALTLNRNKLTGTIPTEIGLLTELSMMIVLDENTLNGTIPTELARLVNLANLEIRDNQLTGPIPSVLGKMTALFLFGVEANSLNGTIPTELGWLTSLTSLALSTNQLTGAIPTTFGLMTGLTLLDVSENQLMSTIPTELGLVTNLRILDLTINLLNGTIPSELAGIQAMEEISVAINELTGTVPTEMASIPNLEFVFVHSNDITGDLGPYFCERSTDIEVFIADCFVDAREVLCGCCTDCCEDSTLICYSN